MDLHHLDSHGHGGGSGALPQPHDDSGSHTGSHLDTTSLSKFAERLGIFAFHKRAGGSSSASSDTVGRTAQDGGNGAAVIAAGVGAGDDKSSNHASLTGVSSTGRDLVVPPLLPEDLRSEDESDTISLQSGGQGQAFTEGLSPARNNNSNNNGAQQMDDVPLHVVEPSTPEPPSVRRLSESISANGPSPVRPGGGGGAYLGRAFSPNRPSYGYKNNPASSPSGNGTLGAMGKAEPFVEEPEPTAAFARKSSPLIDFGSFEEESSPMALTGANGRAAQHAGGSLSPLDSHEFAEATIMSPAVDDPGSTAAVRPRARNASTSGADADHDAQVLDVGYRDSIMTVDLDFELEDVLLPSASSGSYSKAGGGGGPVGVAVAGRKDSAPSTDSIDALFDQELSLAR